MEQLIETFDHDDDDYILYITQHANFKSRSMLIPAKEFLKIRNKEYNLLKKHAIKNKIFTNINFHRTVKTTETCTVDNLLYDIYVPHNKKTKCFSQEQQLRDDFCFEMKEYANGIYKDYCHELKDKIWYDKTICNICEGFDAIYNYKTCRELTNYDHKKINIIEGFLILEQ